MAVFRALTVHTPNDGPDVRLARTVDWLIQESDQTPVEELEDICPIWRQPPARSEFQFGCYPDLIRSFWHTGTRL